MVIRFYSHTKGDWRCFSNFYVHDEHLVIDGIPFATTEHFFQSQKFLGEDGTPEARQRQLILCAETPYEAKKLGSRGGCGDARLRPDWEEVKEEVMLRGLRSKFEQDQVCREVLLRSGDHKLVEAARGDYYWGEGADGSGLNRLGMLLMQVRSEMQ